MEAENHELPRIIAEVELRLGNKVYRVSNTEKCPPVQQMKTPF